MRVSEQQSRQRRWWTPRTAAFVAAFALAVYLVLMGERAFVLITSGRWAFVLFGVGVLVLPLIGALLVYDQLRFGVRTERLSRRFGAAGARPGRDR